MRQLLLGATLVLIAGLLTGCNKEDYRLVFSHYLHVTENEMACEDCHGEMNAGDFSLPGHDVCTNCHDDWIETEEVDDETCGMCHKAKDLTKLSERTPAKPVSKVRGVFRHTDALANRCADCHDTLMDEELSSVPKMTRGKIVKIREQAHRSGLACLTCHEDMDPKTPPPSHHQNWTRRHGAFATQEDNACAVCHVETSCRDCHQVTMPADHNNLWREKTHGIESAWDRARCLVCHEQDSCDACHSSTRPRSHTANWGERHCTQCHASSETGLGCTVCHETDLGGHPSPHTAGWQSQHCQSCHPGTPEGDQCAVCHSGITVESHPNPHGAGWQAQHCTSCHPGTPEGDECAVCHGGNLTAGHPNPHGAGWESRHCDSCHSGTPEGAACGICHVGVNLSSHPNPHGAGWQSRHCSSCHVGTPEADQCAACHEGGNRLLVHAGEWPSYHDRFAGSVDESICRRCH